MSLHRSGSLWHCEKNRSEMPWQLYGLKFGEWGRVTYIRSINSSIPADGLKLSSSIVLHLKIKVLKV